MHIVWNWILSDSSFGLKETTQFWTIRYCKQWFGFAQRNSSRKESLSKFKQLIFLSMYYSIFFTKQCIIQIWTVSSGPKWIFNLTAKCKLKLQEGERERRRWNVCPLHTVYQPYITMVAASPPHPLSLALIPHCLWKTHLLVFQMLQHLHSQFTVERDLGMKFFPLLRLSTCSVSPPIALLLTSKPLFEPR